MLEVDGQLHGESRFPQQPQQRVHPGAQVDEHPQSVPGALAVTIQDLTDESPTPPIRVVLVDDHQMVLDGLAAMLRPHADAVELVGAVTDPAAAPGMVRDLEPDVCLLDVRLRGASGFDVCTEVLRLAPATKVVFLTVYDDEQYLFQALQAGASGYLLKQVSGPELVGHLARVLAGDVAVDPSLAGRVAMS